LDADNLFDFRPDMTIEVQNISNNPCIRGLLDIWRFSILYISNRVVFLI